MAQTHTVNIKNMKYQPPAITIAAGDSVQWTNLDAMGHTVTADDGAFDSGELDQGDTFTQAFAAAGEVPYHCEIHPASMKAKVIVTEVDAA
jgi:plastocyanin